MSPTDRLRALSRPQRPLLVVAVAAGLAIVAVPLAATAAGGPKTGAHQSRVISTIDVAADLREGAERTPPVIAASQASAIEVVPASLPVVFSEPAASRTTEPSPTPTTYDPPATPERDRDSRPTPVAPPATSVDSADEGFGVWDRLAECESGGDWSIDTGAFDGGLQFVPSTWLAEGGGQYASYAYLASPAEQINVAERLLAATGGNYRASWPGCAAKLGLP